MWGALSGVTIKYWRKNSYKNRNYERGRGSCITPENQATHRHDRGNFDSPGTPHINSRYRDPPYINQLPLVLVAPYVLTLTKATKDLAASFLPDSCSAACLPPKWHRAL